LSVYWLDDKGIWSAARLSVLRIARSLHEAKDVGEILWIHKGKALLGVFPAWIASFWEKYFQVVHKPAKGSIVSLWSSILVEIQKTFNGLNRSASIDSFW